MELQHVGLARFRTMTEHLQFAVATRIPKEQSLSAEDIVW